ncbi:MAG: hypothetical protein U0Z44_15965 [Kouleothrix sp.]
MHGSVHDESAHSFGVAGHAGLFSSAADLAQFGRMWLSAITGAAPGAAADRPGLRARLAASNQTPALSLGCGLADDDRPNSWVRRRPVRLGTPASPARRSS